MLFHQYLYANCMQYKQIIILQNKFRKKNKTQPNFSWFYEKLKISELCQFNKKKKNTNMRISKIVL